MKQSVAKLVLFTLAACPTGRNMGNVLRELAQIYPSIEIETLYVEMEVETTNLYRIKTNPTLLFLDANEKELYRLEGFHETDEVSRILNEINNNKLTSSAVIEENRPTMENYTIYLFKNGEPVSIDIQRRNETSIKAPRITVLNLLLVAHLEGYENPFPMHSKLEKVEFEESLAVLTIKTQGSGRIENTDKMETLLLKTLAPFGINKIKLSFSV